MIKHRVWIICLVVAAVWISGCQREPSAKVLSITRVRGVALDPAAPAQMADDGMVFLVVDLDTGKDLGSEPAMNAAKNASLVDKQGRAYTRPGTDYKRDTSPNRITLYWSVPEDQRVFTLVYDNQRLDLDPSKIAEGFHPPAEESTQDAPAPEAIPTVPGGVEGGTIDEPPPPGKQPKPPETISGEVLNDKAISLPKPPYPAIAKAAKASGTVTVQVTVDESGKVISASAVGGHPLLRQAAVQSAYQARFAPTMVSGKPVKVTGVITYNFALQ